MKNRFIVLVQIIGLFLLPWRSGAASPPPVQIMGAADLLAQVRSNADESAENRLQIRSAEFSLYAPVDHLFDGVLTFAGHNDDGRFEWDIHEAYVQTSKLIPRTQLKVGKFLLGIGRLNQFHQHDWPFVSAPRVHSVFFADEAAMDTGVQMTTVLPTETFQDLTVGVTNGYCYGHCDQLGQRPKVPLHYLRWGVGGENSLVGLNYWGYTDFSGERVWHTGIDSVWKRREGTLLRDLFQAEVYYRNKSPEVDRSQQDVGSYFYYQRGFDEQWSAGIRFDLFSELSRRWEVSDAKRENLDYGLTLQTTYKPSEFSFLRAGYSREVFTQKGEDAKTNDALQVQFVYILGSHPAHEF